MNEYVLDINILLIGILCLLQLSEDVQKSVLEILKETLTAKHSAFDIGNFFFKFNFFKRPAFIKLFFEMFKLFPKWGTLLGDWRPPDWN